MGFSGLWLCLKPWHQQENSGEEVTGHSTGMKLSVCTSLVITVASGTRDSCDWGVGSTCVQYGKPCSLPRSPSVLPYFLVPNFPVFSPYWPFPNHPNTDQNPGALVCLDLRSLFPPYQVDYRMWLTVSCCSWGPPLWNSSMAAILNPFSYCANSPVNQARFFSIDCIKKNLIWPWMWVEIKMSVQER